MDTQILDSLPIRDRDKDAIKKYVSAIKQKFGDDVLSIIIYGSAVKDNYFPGASDLNLMVVFPEFTSEKLKAISPIAKGFRGRNRIESFVTGLNDIETSTDVFPIRYLDIKKHHRVLVGKPIFDKIEIDSSNLRFDLERQVRNISLRLRQMYMHSNYTAGELRTMVVSNFSGFSRHLATLLYLMGVETPVKKEDIIRKAGEHLDLDVSVLEKIIQLKQGGNTPPRTAMLKIFDEYLKIVNIVVETVDKFIVA